MVTIDNVLKTKGHDVIFVSPDITVFHALKLMAEKDIGAVLVLDNEKVVGLFSERDYARKVVLKGRSSRDMETREAMTTPVFYIDKHRTIQDCMVLMTEKKLRYVIPLSPEYHAEVVRQIIDFNLTSKQVKELCESDSDQDEQETTDEEVIPKQALRIARLVRSSAKTSGADLARALVQQEEDKELARVHLRLLRRVLDDAEVWLDQN